MITAITTLGKYHLFKSGWTTRINKINLYTDTGVLVDTQAVTFAYSGATQKISPTAQIEFEVTAGTNDVSYVSLIYNDGSNDIVLYNKSFAMLYDFPTTGYLRIEAWEIGINATNSVTWDRQYLFTQGWETLIDWIGAYIGQSDTLIGTSGITGATANISTGELECDDTIISIPASTTGINTLTFGYLGALSNPIVLYKVELGTSYSFTNEGTLLIENLKFTL